jgi:CDP-6-deoxy-D-xylo-4-hexulose-3-dehydrase
MANSDDWLLASVDSAIQGYCDARHDFSFNSAKPSVRLHEPAFGSEEIQAAVRCLLSTRVTMAEKVQQFEGEFSQTIRSSHGVMANSGSSANLLAIAALSNPVTQGALQAGDEVIVPALSWSTTVWPLIQCNLVPVFVDIDPLTLNMDPVAVEKAIGAKTRAIMIVPVYGNPCDMQAILDICQRHNLLLIEDCCEALGSTYNGQPVGSFGRVSTFSFYYSHHITTIEGGMCVTNDFDLAETMRILRAHGWVREVQNPQPYYDKHPQIDPRFLFVNIGYNLRPMELQGAMGLVQLPKLAGFVDNRRRVAAALRAGLDSFSDLFTFQEETPNGYHSWFGFPLTLREKAAFSVDEMRAFLTSVHIESRPVICGNVAMQPAVQLYPHRVAGDLLHASNVMHRALAIPAHHLMDAAACEYVVGRIKDFINKRG